MGSLGSGELLLVFFIVVVLFGVGRVGRLGGELGSAIREFRRGLNEDDGKAHEDDEVGGKP